MKLNIRNRIWIVRQTLSPLGEIRKGVKTHRTGFYPHPSLPPRRKEQIPVSPILSMKLNIRNRIWMVRQTLSPPGGNQKGGKNTQNRILPPSQPSPTGEGADTGKPDIINEIEYKKQDLDGKANPFPPWGKSERG